MAAPGGVAALAEAGTGFVAGSVTVTEETGDLSQLALGRGVGWGGWAGSGCWGGASRPFLGSQLGLGGHRGGSVLGGQGYSLSAVSSAWWTQGCREKSRTGQRWVCSGGSAGLSGSKPHPDSGFASGKATLTLWFSFSSTLRPCCPPLCPPGWPGVSIGVTGPSGEGGFGVAKRGRG